MKMNPKSKYISNLFSRVLIITIVTLFILIINKYNHSFSLRIKDYLFNKSFNFIKVNKISQKVLGKDVFYYHNNNDSIQVFGNGIGQDKSEKYFDAEKMYVSSNLPIGNISSGVVVFIGNKDHYNNTIVVQGLDGYNIWYGNIKDVNVKLYDYVEQHSLIGSADGEYIYLLIEKNNKYYTYDEYVQNKN